MYGVDIVLNSVTGAAQRTGLELPALGGRFVVLGKRDIYGDAATLAELQAQLDALRTCARRR